MFSTDIIYLFSFGVLRQGLKQFKLAFKFKFKLKLNLIYS